MKKGGFVSILLFFLVVEAFYTLVGNIIPQVESRPPKEIRITRETSIDDLVFIGERIMKEKGGCFVCHELEPREAQPRAPAFKGPDPIGRRASRRVPGMDADHYLWQSLVDPRAYVVKGFFPIMPPVNKPPVNLSDEEIVAVIAFLESLGGEVTISLDKIPRLKKDLEGVKGGR